MELGPHACDGATPSASTDGGASPRWRADGAELFQASSEGVFAPSFDPGEPARDVHPVELGDSSVNPVVRPWCKTEHDCDVHFHVTREAKTRFDAEDETIPSSPRDVQLHQVARGAARNGSL